MLSSNYCRAMFFFITCLLLVVSSINAHPVKVEENAKSEPITLIVKKYPITINNKTVNVYRIEQPDGTWGYEGIKGKNFDVLVKNEIDQPTVLHWHGLILPYQQDGVPYITQPPIMPGHQYHYRFKLMQAGTFWMHSHYAFQLQQQLSAPLIIKDPRNKASQVQDVVMLLTDFSFRDPQLLWNELRNKNTMPKPDAQMQPQNTMQGMRTGQQPSANLNDVAYDALLTNYRTLANPDAVTVQPGKLVRLRIIDGAAGTNFFVNLGTLQGKVIAADGSPTVPLVGSVFTLVMGQRLDILVKIPEGPGAYPIIAQGEGGKLQTGLVLVTPAANIPILNQTADKSAGTVTNAQDFLLKPRHSLGARAVSHRLVIDLTGDMQNYVWKINGQVWPNVTPLTVKKNERVEIIFNNKTMMSHPMHLHGHVFQITEIDGQPVKGARRDTVLIMPNSTLKIQLNASYPGNWLLHCHVLYHGEGGMMTLMNYPGIPLPRLLMKFNNIKQSEDWLLKSTPLATSQNDTQVAIRFAHSAFEIM